MERFKDHENEIAVWAQIVIQDDITDFKPLWENNAPNIQSLLHEVNTMSKTVSNPLIFSIMTSEAGHIRKYLKDKNKDIYREALFHFINDHNKPKQNNWYLVLNDISANERYTFVKRLLDWFDDNNELSEFVLFQQWNDLSLFQALWKKGDVEALKYVLFDERLQSDNDKCKSLAQLFASEIPSNFSDTLKVLSNGSNDIQIFNKFSMIFDLYTRNDRLVSQHKPFNYFTLKTS
eukprot:673155_1